MTTPDPPPFRVETPAVRVTPEGTFEEVLHTAWTTSDERLIAFLTVNTVQGAFPLRRGRRVAGALLANPHTPAPMRVVLVEQHPDLTWLCLQHPDHSQRVEDFLARSCNPEVHHELLANTVSVDTLINLT